MNYVCLGSDKDQVHLLVDLLLQLLASLYRGLARRSLHLEFLCFTSHAGEPCFEERGREMPSGHGAA